MKHRIFWIFVRLVWFGQILCHVLKCFKMPRSSYTLVNFAVTVVKGPRGISG